MKIIEPATPGEFTAYYRLRYQVLRQPWHQPEGSERAPDDDLATHALLLDEDGQAVGVCRLHLHTPQEGQIRFMGIRPDKQGLRLGDRLLAYMEARAKEMGAGRMSLQARENAVNFYRRNGYEVVAKTHLLFGTIQHYLMAKTL